MRKFTTIVLVLLAQVSLAQNWSWVKQFGQSPNPDQTNELDIYDLKFSSNGNIYVTGSYISNVVIGGVTYLGYPDALSIKTDIFLFKLNSDGNVLWVKTMGSTENDLPESIVIDNNENVYLCGRFRSTCDFGGGHTLVSTGGFDSFIAKYNSSGQIQWAIKSAYGGANDRTTAITIGQDSHIYAAGLSKGDFTVGDGTTGDSYTNPDSKNDLFLANYTTNGVYRWSKQIPGNNDNNIFRSIACDEQNNLYVGGALAGTLTVDGIDYTSAGNGDIILMKAHPTDGSAIWVRKGGSTADD
ncbi:MAG TPA: SBBP repeat-containing protein, partial [Tenuifilaceae bacterium]|nr:SBBP repeat-containing protein [Tenuifilaceae bacterium]HPM90669.1 SBBP repeat-containing protein [Tenuifilaceae bacterium]